MLTGLPAFGVAKTAFVGTHDLPGPARGAHTPILLGTEEVGRALRTRDAVKPVYVSQGHRFALGRACDLVLTLTPASASRNPSATPTS